LKKASVNVMINLKILLGKFPIHKSKMNNSDFQFSVCLSDRYKI